MSPVVRKWAAPIFALVAVVLLPWAFWLSTALPSRHLSEHWDVAWAGFDLLLAGTLATTALSALKRSPLLPASATASGSLLLVDAWFDVVTSDAGRELGVALMLALLCELPLAVLCFWVARDAERFYSTARRLRKSES
jgi:hypothetical protein